MHKKINTLNFHTSNQRSARLFIVAFMVLQLASCGNNHPELSYLKVFDERFSTVLETTDSAQLSQFSELFYDRQEASNVQADLNFIYLFDITINTGAERWRCTKNGYCRLQLEGATPNREIFYIERHKELFQMSNLD